MCAYELNFDGLVGLTHHYAGLSFGNVASTRNQHQVANPRLAAQQGLQKMKRLADMGFRQAVLPPHARPQIELLRQLGFSGTDAQVLARAGREAPRLLSAVSSASAMWTANAATVSPSCDTADRRVHFTVANLNNKFHRASEAETTGAMLGAIFADERHFAHHAPLPQVAMFGDEGAANHNRLCRHYGESGIEVFVYGREAAGGVEPRRFPARQTREACEAVIRLHQLDPERCVLVQQDPDVIDQGVFHNDVIAVSNRNVLFHHQRAFHRQQQVLDEIRHKLALQESELQSVEVPEAAVSVADAVATYLFNSQLLSKPDGKMLLVVPEESRQHAGVWGYLDSLVGSGGPIDEVQVFDLRESMRNGGGPACLRLRVVLTDAELAAMAPGVLMNDRLYLRLCGWVDRHYRDRLTEADLVDPQLLLENYQALDELTQILGLGAIYPFQR